MAISFVSNALGGTTTTTSFSITLPTTQAGDIIILEFAHRGTGDGNIAGTSVTTGELTWALKHDQTFASSAFSGKTYWARATGDHSGQTVTGSSLTNSCAAIVTVYRGAQASGDPLADATIVGEENASGNETQAEITTNTNGAWVVLVVVNSPDLAVSTQAATDPSSLTERAERQSTGGGDTSIAHASDEKATAGATGSFTWAQTDGASGSWAYAIKPELPPTVVLNSPADASSDSDTTPTLDFTGTDLNSNDIRYRLQIDDVNDFNPSTVTFDAKTQSVQSEVTTSSNISHTITGSNPLLVVAVHNDTIAESVSGITWGGVALTKIGVASSSGCETEMWYLKAPATGTANVVVTMSGVSDFGVTILSYTGVDQIAPLDAFNTATGDSTTPSVDLTTTETSTMVIDAGTLDDTGQTGTAGANQTERADYASDFNTCFTSEEPAATVASYTMSWTITGSSPWGIVAAAFKRATTPNLNKISGTDAGFANPDVGGDTDPFTSGHNIQYTVQAGDALSAGTYYWRVRGIDPAGSTATYYFDASDAGPTDPNAAWTNDANGFDGNTGTTTTATLTGSAASNYIRGDGTTAPTSGGDITQVSARIHRGSGTQNVGYEIFTSGLGESLGSFSTGLGTNYSSYVDLTTPTGGWTWQKINDLVIKYWGISTAGSFALSKAEIKVTIGTNGGNFYGAWSSTRSFTITGGGAASGNDWPAFQSRGFWSRR